MVTVDVYTIILLISQFHTFFSLFSVCKTNSVSDFSSPHLLFPQIHTNTPTQTHSHRQINTEIHKYTYMDKPIERERERVVLVLAAYGSMLVAKIRVCESMQMGLDACGLTEMGFNACGSVLAMEISACGF